MTLSGPLAGIRIIEFAGIGPVPFAGMMLADHGADVIRIDRPGAADPRGDILLRSRRSIALDLKQPAAVAVARALVATADGLIEGFRPGVMERLGLGPELLIGERPVLVYGRMTGWGQDGPLAHAAGHDIDYIALSGNLHTYGRAGGKPTPPANAVGDFGGGGMMLAFGMVAALLAVRGGAAGQVVDCAMVDGAAALAAMTWSMWQRGEWSDERGVNLLDTGAPFYDTYETADGKWLALGAIEPQFFAELLRRTGLEGDPHFAAQYDRAKWPAMRERLTALFLTRSRDEWSAALEESDACAAPILSLAEAPRHPHLISRRTFIEVDGVTQAAPVPRFSAVPAATPRPARAVGEDGDALLTEVGFDAGAIAKLRASGAVG